MAIDVEVEIKTIYTSTRMFIFALPHTHFSAPPLHTNVCEKLLSGWNIIAGWRYREGGVQHPLLVC